MPPPSPRRQPTTCGERGGHLLKPADLLQLDSMLHVLAFISSIADAKTSSLPTVIVSFCPWDNWKWFLVLILTLKSSIYNRDHLKTTLTWSLSYNTNRMGKIIMHSSIFTLNTPHSLDVMVMPACTKYAEKGEEVRASYKCHQVDQTLKHVVSPIYAKQIALEHSGNQYTKQI